MRPARRAPRNLVAAGTHLADHTPIIGTLRKNHAVSNRNRINHPHPPDRLHAAAARTRRGFGIFELFPQTSRKRAHHHAIGGLDDIMTEVMTDNSTFIIGFRHISTIKLKGLPTVMNAPK